MARAPPAVPGMLAPNSSPSSPAAAARWTARGRLAPPPDQPSAPRTRMACSRPTRRRTSPRKPASATSRFEPLPTTATRAPASRAQASTATADRNEPTAAVQSAGPPTRIVVRGASGAPGRSSGGVGAATAIGGIVILDSQAADQLLPQPAHVAGAEGQHQVPGA